MSTGLGIMVLGHISFAVLPALQGMVFGALCFGIYIPLFWLPLNSLIVRETHSGNRAGRLAAITAVFAITGVLAPILGGFLADRVNYRAVLGLAAFIVGVTFLLGRTLAQADETLSFSLDLRGVAL